MLREQATAAAAARRNGGSAAPPPPAKQEAPPKRPPVRRKLGTEAPPDPDAPPPPPPPETCVDGELNNGETDTDCGGDKCRHVGYVREGHSYKYLCKHAQKCTAGDDCLSKVCSSSAGYTCSPRPAFASVAAADLFSNLHTSYFDLSSERSDKLLHNSDLLALLTGTLNPDGQDAAGSLSSYLAAECNDFREEQGLQDDEAVLRWGFVSRGRCLRFATALSAELAHAKDEL